MTKFFFFLGRTGTKTQRAQFQIFATVRTKEVLGPLVHWVNTKKIRLSRCLCSISFSHRERIDLFSAPSFCPSDHFTSAAEWQKFTRIGLGFAPDRLFCLLPLALLSAYLLVSSNWSAAVPLLWEALTKEEVSWPISCQLTIARHQVQLGDPMIMT